MAEEKNNRQPQTARFGPEWVLTEDDPLYHAQGFATFHHPANPDVTKQQ